MLVWTMRGRDLGEILRELVDLADEIAEMLAFSGLCNEFILREPLLSNEKEYRQH